MSKMAALFGLFLATSTLFPAAARAEEVLKTCSFDVHLGEGPKMPTTYVIKRLETGAIVAEGTQVDEGKQISLPLEVATVTEYTIRPNLTEASADMNVAESLIVGTREMLKEKEMKAFSVGLDLNQVASVTAYEIGKFTHMGGTMIMEARDAEGAAMGSFVTGFLPFACK